MGVFEVFLMTIFIINIVIIISMYFIDKFKFNKILKNFLGLIFIVGIYYLSNFFHEKYLLIENPFSMLLEVIIILTFIVEVIEQVIVLIKLKLKK